MLLFELFDDPLAQSYYDSEFDVLNTRHLTDTRKQPITLRLLNRWKRARKLAKAFSQDRLELVAAMYSNQDVDSVKDELDIEKAKAALTKAELAIALERLRSRKGRSNWPGLKSNTTAISLWITLKLKSKGAHMP